MAAGEHLSEKLLLGSKKDDLLLEALLNCLRRISRSLQNNAAFQGHKSIIWPTDSIDCIKDDLLHAIVNFIHPLLPKIKQQVNKQDAARAHVESAISMFMGEIH
jgi:hypothetical protein